MNSDRRDIVLALILAATAVVVAIIIMSQPCGPRSDRHVGRMECPTV